MKGAIPCFLIVNAPDFEYVACLHDPSYMNQRTDKYIVDSFGMKNLAAFKRRRDVYDFLNSSDRSYRVMLNRIRPETSVVVNTYRVRRQTFEVQISKTEYKEENAARKGSNIGEFFDVIDWKA